MNELNQSQQYSSGQEIEFIKKALVFDRENKTSFYVEKGTKGIIIADDDVGEVGSCKIKLNTDNKEIIVETNDENIQKLS